MVEQLIPLTPSVSELSRTIGSVAAPAFLLGAVASFISVLVSLMNRVIDRSQFLHSIPEGEGGKAYLKSDIPRLKRRAKLLNRSVFFATLCAITTSVLIIIAFVSAVLHVPHEYGVAICFVLALVFFLLALVDLARQARLGLSDLDHLT